MPESENNRGPKLFAVVPVKNETDRYLEACLRHLMDVVQVDGLMVYDDHSDDYVELREIVDDVAYGATCRLAGQHFIDHEGAFRTEMLDQAAGLFRPRPGIDWILVNDADEFLASPTLPISEALNLLMAHAEAETFLFGLDELWQIVPPKKRIDKAWGDIRNRRIFRYWDRSLTVSDAEWATGSVPQYAVEATVDVHKEVRIVHAGYAAELDRMPKYLRHKDHTGHSTAHVLSILDIDVQLEGIDYCQGIYRGRR